MSQNQIAISYLIASVLFILSLRELSHPVTARRGNILGMIGVAPPTSSSTVHVIGGGVDADYIARFTRAHEDAGFDAVLIGHR